jgi:hypothetical protein
MSIGKVPEDRPRNAVNGIRWLQDGVVASGPYVEAKRPVSALTCHSIRECTVMHLPKLKSNTAHERFVLCEAVPSRYSYNRWVEDMSRRER